MKNLLVLVVVFLTVLTTMVQPATATEDERFPLVLNQIGGRWLTDGHGNVRVLAIRNQEELLAFLHDVNLVNHQLEAAYPQIFASLRVKHGIETGKAIQSGFPGFTKSELEVVLERAIVRYAIFQLAAPQMEVGLSAYRQFYAGTLAELPSMVTLQAVASQPGTEVASAQDVRFVAQAPLPEFPPRLEEPAVANQDNDGQAVVTFTNIAPPEPAVVPAPTAPTTPLAEMPAEVQPPTPAPTEEETTRLLDLTQVGAQVNFIGDQVQAWGLTQPVASMGRTAALYYVESIRAVLRARYTESNAQQVEAVLRTEVPRFAGAFDNASAARRASVARRGYQANLALLDAHLSLSEATRAKGEIEALVALASPTPAPSSELVVTPSTPPPASVVEPPVPEAAPSQPSLEQEPPAFPQPSLETGEQATPAEPDGSATWRFWIPLILLGYTGITWVLSLCGIYVPPFWRRYDRMD